MARSTSQLLALRLSHDECYRPNDTGRPVCQLLVQRWKRKEARYDGGKRGGKRDGGRQERAGGGKRASQKIMLLCESISSPLDPNATDIPHMALVRRSPETIIRVATLLFLPTTRCQRLSLIHLCDLNEVSMTRDSRHLSSLPAPGQSHRQLPYRRGFV